MLFPDDPAGRCMFKMLSVEFPTPLLMMLLFNNWTQVMFGAGVPLAAQLIVRSCPSLMVLVGGGEIVN